MYVRFRSDGVVLDGYRVGVIVLDTNVIEPFKTLDAPPLDVLFALARASRQAVAVPHIVFEEYMAHRIHDVEVAVDKARSAAAELAKRAPDWAVPTFPDPRESVAPLQQRLRTLVRVLEPRPGDAEESLRREAHREAPARQIWQQGKPNVGARDVSVWLAALEAARSTSETVYLVTEDTGFHSEGQLLKVLADEADREDVADRLVFCPGLSALIGQLGERQDTQVEVAVLAVAEATRAAVADRFSTANVDAWDMSFGPDTKEMWVSYAEWDRPELLEAGGSEPVYRVEDKEWATFRAEWAVRVSFSSGNRVVSTARVRSKLTVLARLDEDHQVVEAEVLDSRPSLEYDST